MADTHVTVVGNLTGDPELKFTTTGHALATFRVAVTGRVKDGDTWKDGETSFYRIVAWRDLAEHVTESLSKGDRALVQGQLRQRSWQTDDGDKRSVVEIQADEIGVSLKWAIARPEKAGNRGGNGGPAKGGQFDEEPSWAAKPGDL
jgi:single-strand DNA-binding protein